MKLSLPYSNFKEYVRLQIDHFFPDGICMSDEPFSRSFDLAMERTRYCFSHVKLPQYSADGDPYLNHLHSDQYAVFLWFLSSSVWKETKDSNLSNKLFYLNKSLHGFSCMYDTTLPEVFLLLHTVGTVLGKAEYGNFFVAAHGCTVGAQNGRYPRIGQGVAMLTHSSIIGNCMVGAFVSVGINTVVYKTDIPDRHIAFVNQEGKFSMKQSSFLWSKLVFRLDDETKPEGIMEEP